MKKLFYILLLITISNAARAQCKYIWANWVNQGSVTIATATLTVNGSSINMNMTANYNFAFTPGIYSYPTFLAYSDPPADGTVPQTTWAAGPGGQTTMCFSQPVVNPVLLISSLGNPGTTVSLQFSVPYTVVFDGGGTVYNNNTTITSNEGYFIIEFTGTFTCVTIYSSTPESYSNITWGIKNPLTAGFTFTNGCVANANSFTSTSTINPPGAITQWDWSFGDGATSTATNPTHSYSAAGTYPVLLKVTSDNGCVDTAMHDVTVFPSYAVNNPQTICGGQVYSFNQHNYSATGTYNDTILTIHGCDSIVITQLTVTPVYSSIVVATVCQGETYTLPGGSTVGSTGTYSDTLQTNTGCDSIIITQLTVNPVYSATIAATICGGEFYQLPVNGPANTTGTYYDTLQTTAGCDSVIITQLTVNPVFTQNVAATICQGATYHLPGGTDVTTTGTYSDTLQTVLGCDSVIVTQLTVNPAFTQNMAASICYGETWQRPNGQIMSSTGVFVDTFQTSVGCDSIIISTLTVFPELIDSALVTDVSCYGNNDGVIELQMLSGTAPYTFSLNGQASNSTGMFSQLDRGNYSYVITDNNGCRVSSNATVLEPDELHVTLNISNTTVAAGKAVQLIATSNNAAATYLWNPSTFLSCDDCASPLSNPTQNIIYSVSATVANNGNSCVAQATVSIQVLSTVFVPNAFTPNGDGNNDTWAITTASTLFFNLQVFNRWGEKVFDTNDISHAWDGTINSQPAQPGVYIYHCTLVNASNETRSINGSVTLIR